VLTPSNRQFSCLTTVFRESVAGKTDKLNFPLHRNHLCFCSENQLEMVNGFELKEIPFGRIFGVHIVKISKGDAQP
jgi:hypothetical protein